MAAAGCYLVRDEPTAMPATTTPVLFPSGEDANPLHKRLPAEVVTRKRRPEAKQVDEKPVDEVKVDFKTAIALKPDARPKWLTKACKMADENRASTTELYNIITSRKFLGGLPGKIGRRLRDITHENLGLFSDKQQRHLKSDDWILNAKYGDKAGEEGDPEAPAKEENQEEPAEPSPREAEEKERRPGPEAKAEEKRVTKKRPERREAEEQQGAWNAVPSARGQEERVLREAALAEERARRKEREREEQERWMEAEAEASRRRALQQEEAKKRKVEDEVDSSLMLLEQLGQQRQAPRQEPARERHDEDGRRRGLSRSRSIRVRSRSRRRKKSRSARGSRRRRRSGSCSRPRVDFADALRRRMEEREANDTTRIPVVDPGHAARWATR